jgi:excisionase family DNA binding protein
MNEPILTIDEAAEQTPWSKTTLYRVAPDAESPFTKRGGRWVTTESDLLAWVRSGPKPKSRSIGNPMPRVRGHRSSFAAKLASLEGGH